MFESADVPVAVVLRHECPVLGMEVGLSGTARLGDLSGWDESSQGVALPAGGCSVAGSKVSTDRGCKTSSALLDVQPLRQLSDTSAGAMSQLGLPLEVRTCSCALGRCCVSLAVQGAVHSFASLGCSSAAVSRRWCVYGSW